jgi:hypothetical protein
MMLEILVVTEIFNSNIVAPSINTRIVRALYGEKNLFSHDTAKFSEN